MLPVVLRFTHPAWGFVLPATTAVLTVLLGWTWLSARRAASRSASLFLASAVLLTAAATLYAVRRPLVPAPVIVHAFGVFLCVAVLSAWGAAGYAVKQVGLDRSKLAGAFVACGIGALLGGRLLFVLTVPMPGWREGLALHHGGLSLWGGLFGGALALWVHCRLTQQSVWQWSAALGPAALLAVALGRVGCFASGSHFGRELPVEAWPVLRGLGTYPRWSDAVMAVAAGPPVWLAQVEQREITAVRVLSNPTHPVQLYEAVAVAVLFGLALKYRQRWKSPRQMCCALGFAYAAIAFALEWLRGDVDRGFLGPSLQLSVALWGSALMLMAMLWLMLRSFEWGASQRMRWGVVFALGYGVLMWSIASQLGQDHVRMVRVSVAQALAMLAAVWVAFAAAGIAARAQLSAPAAPADPQ